MPPKHHGVSKTVMCLLCDMMSWRVPSIFLENDVFSQKDGQIGHLLRKKTSFRKKMSFQMMSVFSKDIFLALNVIKRRLSDIIVEIKLIPM